MTTLDEEKLKECKSVFDIFDKEKKGSITKKDLGDIMRILGTFPTENELENIISNLENPDLISYEKFLEIFKKKYELKDTEEDKTYDFTNQHDIQKIADLLNETDKQANIIPLIDKYPFSDDAFITYPPGHIQKEYTPLLSLVV